MNSYVTQQTLQVCFSYPVDWWFFLLFLWFSVGKKIIVEGGVAQRKRFRGE